MVFTNTVLLCECNYKKYDVLSLRSRTFFYCIYCSGTARRFFRQNDTSYENYKNRLEESNTHRFEITS